MSVSELVMSAQAIGRESIDLARQLYQVWLSFNPTDPLAYVVRFNCSVLQDKLGDLAGAETELRAALSAHPEFAPASINLGGLLERRGQVVDGLQVWQAALDQLNGVTGETVDHRVTILKQISRVLSDRHEMALAEVMLAQCLELAPQARDVCEQYAAARLSQCQWPPFSAHPRVPAGSLIAKLHPLSMAAYAGDPLLQLGAANQYLRSVTPVESRTLAFDRRDAAIPSDRPLRVGYLSSDLRHHAVGYLMAELFELHDPAKVETFAYSSGPPSDDPIAQRYRASAGHWRDIRGVSDDDAARMIGEDEIDILVDVNGHTRDARLGVFARRPAPIQVNWLGYPGTMGSAYHHYILADDTIIPPDAEHYYSERVLRVPCYQPNDRRRFVADHRPNRALAGLPDDAFVFCCFNASHKITPFAFDRFMRILQGAEGSVLWLLDYGAATNQRLRDMATQRGVSAERLIFAPKLVNAHHLARYPLADLMLDTAPYGAHTTASDALWMGVPALTILGRSFASRVCASLVRSAGLPELVCDTPEAFVERAIALAGPERERLAVLRARLIEARDACVLFDAPLLVSSMEDRFAEIAAAHRASVRVVPDLRNLEIYFQIGLSIDHEAVETGFRPDYEALYREGLARRHALEPLADDARLHRDLPAPALHEMSRGAIPAREAA